jgi:hypothetical protein
MTFFTLSSTKTKMLVHLVKIFKFGWGALPARLLQGQRDKLRLSLLTNGGSTTMGGCKQPPLLLLFKVFLLI